MQDFMFLSASLGADRDDKIYFPRRWNGIQYKYNKGIREFIEIAINGTNQIDHVIFNGLYSIWPFKQSRSRLVYVCNSF